MNTIEIKNNALKSFQKKFDSIFDDKNIYIESGNYKYNSTKYTQTIIPKLSEVTIADSQFINCISLKGLGGGILFQKHLQDGELHVKRCAFTLCAAYNNGGAIYSENKKVNIDSSCFHECCINVGNGITIYSFSSQFSISRCSIVKQLKMRKHAANVAVMKALKNIDMTMNNFSNSNCKLSAILFNEAIEDVCKLQLGYGQIINSSAQYLIHFQKIDAEIIKLTVQNDTTRNASFIIFDSYIVISNSFIHVSQGIYQNRSNILIILCQTNINDSFVNIQNCTNINDSHAFHNEPYPMDTFLCWDLHSEVFIIKTPKPSKLFTRKKVKYLLIISGIIMLTLAISFCYTVYSCCRSVCCPEELSETHIARRYANKYKDDDNIPINREGVSFSHDNVDEEEDDIL